MQTYDVIIIGGGIAGSVCAKFLAQKKLKTLFVEKYKPPRHKPCSGIQFDYFSRLVGEKFPPEKLCRHQLKRIEIYYPDGSTFGAPCSMYNFMRDVFDDYLNQVAQKYGAEFWAECEYVDHEETAGGVTVDLKKDGQGIRAACSYLIDASGLRPVIRKKLRPADFGKGANGGSINYYIEGKADLDPETLYQFWNLDWNNQMFAWVYNKTMEGREYWVVGSGYDRDLKQHCELFLDFVRQKYHLDGEIIKTEGYSSTISFNAAERIWLGQGRLLMIGDAAGLIDMTRGVGMDAAALSGRLAAQAIAAALKQGKPALEEYVKVSRSLVAQTRKNQTQSINRFSSNEELLTHLRKDMAAAGPGMAVQSVLNRFRQPEQLVLLP
ncbi:MAG TPA: NAD(P)/FAD-dependent oxidoreductase [Anaerolineaceae bacterium]|nr:NAD(P)/FAD-dependent oxidoreductase [Anaerolineaceae bacterium]HPN53643.1 NAD(P)/FAD-dependent oxidoreductase [Anaerolineaceae bacterium]